MADQSKARKFGAPVWLVTFADLMALLFALFVLLLSFSDVDSDSFRRNAGPIAEAFNQKQPIIIKPVQIAPPSKLKIPPQPTTPQPKVASNQDSYLRTVARNRLVNMVKSTISADLTKNRLELVVEANKIIMRFPAHSAFRAGDANLSASIIPTMDRIADILARTEGKISVTGHTDNSPISTAQFRSNWDLSTARAVSVVHRLLRHRGMVANRVSATGRADTQPITDNDSRESRQRNRRVEIVVEIPMR
tara:strand:- start:2544 stop:3290 length:747 start_codon:yes stop_codon:yes gene_type:complete